MTTIKDMMGEESLPEGLDFPSFPSIQFSHLTTVIIFSQDTYFLYILQIPLLQPTVYQLYKLQPFHIRQQENVFVYIATKKDFIFTDAMRHKYGKMTYHGLQACFTSKALSYVCKENVPILTYITNEDCESTLIRPSTISIPNNVCGERLIYLEHTYWIPLYLSNEWLYVAPKIEFFTVLCGSVKSQLNLHSRGRLFLPPRSKGDATQSTIYALSTLVRNNSQKDVLPVAAEEIDCSF